MHCRVTLLLGYGKDHSQLFTMFIKHYRCKILRISSHLRQLQDLLYLKKDKESFCIDGNPIVYDGAIDQSRQQSKLGLCDDVIVCSSEGRRIARGIYNPFSMYRVRLLARPQENDSWGLPLNELIEQRIQSAIQLRTLLLLPSGTTNVARLINSEGDDLSGLVVDLFENTLVVQSSAVWTEIHKSSIIRGLEAAFSRSISTSPDVKPVIVWRSVVERLKSDCGGDITRLTTAIGRDVSAQESNGDVSETKVRENGIVYFTRPGTGQKTGFYCDQRDNRLLVRSIAHGITSLK